jgi:hypothetical protein
VVGRLDSLPIEAWCGQSIVMGASLPIHFDTTVPFSHHFLPAGPHISCPPQSARRLPNKLPRGKLQNVIVLRTFRPLPRKRFACLGCAFQRFWRGCFPALGRVSLARSEETPATRNLRPHSQFGNRYALPQSKETTAMKHTPQVKPRGHTAKGWHAAHPTQAPKAPFLVTRKGKRLRKSAKVLPFPPPSA